MAAHSPFKRGGGGSSPPGPISIRGSANGRPAAFEAAYEGSNPSPRAYGPRRSGAIGRHTRLKPALLRVRIPPSALGVLDYRRRCPQSRSLWRRTCRPRTPPSTTICCLPSTARSARIAASSHIASAPKGDRHESTTCRAVLLPAAVGRRHRPCRSRDVRGQDHLRPTGPIRCGRGRSRPNAKAAAPASSSTASASLPMPTLSSIPAKSMSRPGRATRNSRRRSRRSIAMSISPFCQSRTSASSPRSRRSSQRPAAARAGRGDRVRLPHRRQRPLGHQGRGVAHRVSPLWLARHRRLTCRSALQSTPATAAGRRSWAAR